MIAFVKHSGIESYPVLVLNNELNYALYAYLGGINFINPLSGTFLKRIESFSGSEPNLAYDCNLD